jgi:hypothetical protein
LKTVKIPTTVFTLLRICDAFDIQPEHLVSGLPRKRGKSDRTKDDKV